MNSVTKATKILNHSYMYIDMVVDVCKSFIKLHAKCGKALREIVTLREWIETLDEENDELKEQARWLSVDAALPDISKSIASSVNVLCRLAKGHVEVCGYHHDGFWLNGKKVVVTDWRLTGWPEEK